jgi:splicing suppressor protein 51
MCFPAAQLHLFFIGPQVSLPKPKASTPQAASQTDKMTPEAGTSNSTRKDDATSQKANIDNPSPDMEPPASEKAEERPAYVPNIYQPPTPAPIARLKRTRDSITRYGVPSYTVPYTHALTITGLKSNYSDVHAQFQETFDPYTDCFFLFSPGFGFPSPTSTIEDSVEPLLQIASPTEWGPVIPQLLSTRCPIFVTGFSPADVERDIRSLATAEDVAGKFDWVITPGANSFGSEKWEVADFDPRVMVKTNWGIWGMRGKSRDIKEKEPWGVRLGLRT